jgi:APA family basic amino acid/polyamine antiporter
MALSGEYEQLYTLVMFGIVVFYIVTVVALFVLRRTQPDVERPYRCTGYPVLPAIYIIVTSIWAVAVAYEKPVEALAGTIIVVLGAPLYFYWKKK